jgi:hypothetical protein
MLQQHFARAALANHPDKGGSPEDFRNVRAAFEALRQLYEAEEVPSFTSSDVPSTAEAYRTSKDEFEVTVLMLVPIIYRSFVEAIICLCTHGEPLHSQSHDVINRYSYIILFLIVLPMKSS